MAIYCNFRPNIAYGTFKLFVMNFVNFYIFLLMFTFSPTTKAIDSYRNPSYKYQNCELTSNASNRDNFQVDIHEQSMENVYR